MKTFPDENVQLDYAVGFEIDSAYISIRTIEKILREVDGVSNVEKRKLFSDWGPAHVRFSYLNKSCVVIEPYGDNSRYWIGPENPKEKFNFEIIHATFVNYQPPLFVKYFGDIVTFNFRSLFKRN